MTALSITLIPIMLLVVGCQADKPDAERFNGLSVGDGETGRVLVATLSPTSGNSVSGTVSFSPGTDSTVAVRAVVSGLGTGSRHGIHVHEFGDCSAPDASSAGGHFNPAGSPHGAPTDPADERHAGDLGNLTEVSEGVAELQTNDPLLRLEGDWSIEGKAVVVHAGPDDFTSQPSGAAGPRLACGVIQAEAPQR